MTQEEIKKMVFELTHLPFSPYEHIDRVKREDMLEIINKYYKER